MKDKSRAVFSCYHFTCGLLYEETYKTYVWETKKCAADTQLTRVSSRLPSDDKDNVFSAGNRMTKCL